MLQGLRSQIREVSRNARDRMKRTAGKFTARQRPLVTTKLRPPANHGTLIQRPQLIASLRQTLERKLALVHGPAGFGKTTVASQWFEELKSAGHSVAWLALDGSDNDINRFLGYLVEAIRFAEPDMGRGLSEVIEANPGGATDFVLDSLAGDLSLHDEDFVLFLDDWHLVIEPRVHDALQKFLARSPPNVRVVVTSRTRNGIPLTRLRVQNALVEIDARRLRFDFEESKTYLTQANAAAPALKPDDLMALWRSTEGWAAALQLASLSLRESGDRERIVQWTSGAANDIGEYLAENVMDKLPPDQVRFMLRSSILERMSGELCAAITGEKDSAERLDSLERQQMFLLPLDEERQWYRYHHLFARFLQRRLKKQLPGEIQSLHRAAAQWFGARGQTAEAVEHALQAEDRAYALDLIERDAMPLVEHSSMSTLLNLVSKLPRTALFDRPALQMAIAWANCLTHHPKEVEEALWHVERVAASAEASARARLLAEANLVRACTSIYGDKVEGVERLLQPCLDTPGDFSPFVVGVAANILAYSHIHAREFGKVSPLMRWARDYQDRAKGLFSAVYGRCFEGIAAMRSGQLDTARRAYADAVELATSTAGAQSISARLAGALLGELLYEENDLDQAERLLRESRVLGMEGGVVDFYLATYLSSCRLALQKGKLDEALAILQEGEDTSRALSLERLRVAVACERVRVKLATGDLRAAEQMLGEVYQGRDDTELGPQDDDETRTVIAVARARLLCAHGSASAAIEILREQVQAASRSGCKTQEFGLRALLAVALESDAQPLAAEQTLLAAVSEAVPRGMMRSFLDEGAALIGILDRVRDKARKRAGVEEDAIGFNASAQRLLSISRHPRHGIPRLSAADASVADLSPRETEVLKLVEQGRSNKEIARTLSLSPDTVKWYLKNVFIKLGVSTRVQAIAEMRRMALAGDGP